MSAGQTALTGRAILMVVLVFVMVMGGIFILAFTVSPATHGGPELARQLILICSAITGLAGVWFVFLMVRAILDWKRGVKREAAKVSGWFHVIFGGAVAVAGIVCS